MVRPGATRAPGNPRLTGGLPQQLTVLVVRRCDLYRLGRILCCNDHRGGVGSTAKLVLSVPLQQLIVERLYQVGE